MRKTFVSKDPEKEDEAWRDTPRRTDRIFRLFVYGTLKRGYSNHDLFCNNALNAEEATTFGDLYDLPFGFPAMVVPSKSILAVGTTDYAHDVVQATQAKQIRSQTRNGQRSGGFR